MRFRRKRTALLARALAVVLALLPLVPLQPAAASSLPAYVHEERVPRREAGGDVRVLVATPPSYGYNDRRFPVLYFLHDGQGDENVLFSHGVADALFAEMRAGRMPELVLVAPRGAGTWFVDAYDGPPRFGRFLSEVLVPYVDARFRTLPRRSARAAAGISMGGYGAFRWALRSPRLFGVAAGLSPAVQQLSWRTVQALPFFLRPSLERAFGRASTDRGYAENDLYALLLGDPALARDAPTLLLRCGTEDSYRLDQVSLFFTRFLDAVGVENALVLEKGGHDWAYWKRSFPELVRSVAARLSVGETDS